MPQEDYTELRIIGKGSFGQVFLVKNKRDGKELVMKKMRIGNITDKEREGYHLEVKLLSQLEHPGIVQYVESFIDSQQHNFCIVMAFCDGGDLTSYLKKQKGMLLAEDDVLYNFIQMALALHYMHSRNILHRDLKTQNIFLKNGLMMLGDFGISKVLDGSRDFAQTCIGTPYYMSPELFKNQQYNFKSDIWALGCVLYEMATLKHAFDAESLNGLAGKIIRGVFPPISPNYSQSLRTLIKDMLATNPAARPTIEGILKKPFLRKKIKDFVVKVLKNSSEYRPSDIQSLRKQLDMLGLAGILNESDLPSNVANPPKLALVEQQKQWDERLKRLQEAESAKAKLESALRKLKDEQKWRADQVNQRKQRDVASKSPAPVNAKANDIYQRQKKKLEDAANRKAEMMRARERDVASAAARRQQRSAAVLPDLPKPRAVESRASGGRRPPSRSEVDEDRTRVEQLEQWEQKKFGKADSPVPALPLQQMPMQVQAKAIPLISQREQKAQPVVAVPKTKIQEQMDREQAEIQRIRQQREHLRKKMQEVDSPPTSRAVAAVGSRVSAQPANHVSSPPAVPSPNYLPVLHAPVSARSAGNSPAASPASRAVKPPVGGMGSPQLTPLEPAPPKSLSPMAAAAAAMLDQRDVNSYIAPSRPVVRSQSDMSFVNVQHGAMLASPLNARDRVLAERERKRKADTDRQVAELQALSEEYMEMRSKVAVRGQDLYARSDASVPANNAGGVALIDGRTRLPSPKYPVPPSANNDASPGRASRFSWDLPGSDPAGNGAPMAEQGIPRSRSHLQKLNQQQAAPSPVGDNATSLTPPWQALSKDDMPAGMHVSGLRRSVSVDAIRGAPAYGRRALPPPPSFASPVLEDLPESDDDDDITVPDTAIALPAEDDDDLERTTQRLEEIEQHILEQTKQIDELRRSLNIEDTGDHLDACAPGDYSHEAFEHDVVESHGHLEADEHDGQDEQPWEDTVPVYGRLSDRIQAIRRHCVDAIGESKFIEAYELVSRLKNDPAAELEQTRVAPGRGRSDDPSASPSGHAGNTEDAAEAAMMRSLTHILGKDKLHYGRLIDELIFMEHNHC